MTTGCINRIDPKTKKVLKKNTKKSIFVFLMLIVPIIHFLIFYVYANFSSIMLAFQRLDQNGNYYFTWDNFIQVFDGFRDDGGTLQQALKNSLIFFAWDTFFLLPISIVFSYLFAKKIKGHRFFRFMFFVPTIISGVALTTMYKFMLGNSGPIGYIYRFFTGADATPPFFAIEEYALTTILIYMLIFGFAGKILLIGGAMSRIPDTITDSASLDGVTMWEELFHIYIPMIWPTLSTILITTAAGILCTSGPILLLTNGAGNTYDISFYIFNKVQVQGQYGVPAALGLVLTVVTFPIVMIVRHFVNKIYDDVEF